MATSSAIPQAGQIVRARQRQYLVERVTVHATKVKLFITETSVRVEAETKLNPQGLVTAFTESRAKMIELAGPTVRLLS